MPYALESPLASAAGALGGYLEGVQSKKDKAQQLARQQQQDAQAQADTQARLGLTRAQQEATNAYRNTTSQQNAQRLSIEQGRADAEAAAAKDARSRQQVQDLFKGDERKFFGGEMTLSPDPVKRLGQLQKRYDIERGKGYDTKSTEAQMSKAATEIEQTRRDAALAKQRDTQNSNAAQRIQISVDRGSGGSDRPLTRYQQIEEDHWNKTHNPDGTSKGSGASRDTSGLSSMGSLEYQKDVRDYMLKGGDSSGIPEPDPSDPKYPKKSSVLGTRAPATSAPAASSTPSPQPKTKINPANHKTYYLHDDGNYYTSPP